MTETEARGIDRNIEAANRFLEKVKGLSTADRERIKGETFGSSAHTAAMMAIADEVSLLKNKDRGGRVSGFLVDVEQRVDAMGLEPELGDLVKAAARGLLVDGAPGLDSASRQLYLPFEKVVPRQVAQG